MNKEKLANAWKIIKEACSAVVIGFVTVIIGFFLGFVGRRKNVSDNGSTKDRIRTDIDGLRNNTEELGRTTEDLRKNNSRLRNFIEGLEEDELED